jgi:hypothetical protein
MVSNKNSCDRARFETTLARESGKTVASWWAGSSAVKRIPQITTNSLRIA